MKKWILGALALILMAMPITAAGEMESVYYDLYYEGALVEGGAYFYRGSPYISVETLELCGNTSKLNIDRENRRVSFDLSKLELFIADDVASEYIKKYGGEAYIPMRGIDYRLHVPLNAIAQLAHLEYSMDEYAVYMISTDAADSIILGENVKAAASLLYGSGENLKLRAGSCLKLIGETASFDIMSAPDGEIFYLMKGAKLAKAPGEKAPDFYSAARKKLIPKEPINLCWHNFSSSALIAPEDNIGKDVMAPVWLRQIVNGGGAIENNADLGYVDDCHARGMDVWITITNNMTVRGSTNFTTKVFADRNLRNRTVAQYMFYAALYDADGINIDYEQMRDSDRDGFTAFVKEMRSLSERLGLVLSVDTLIPTSWSIEYDYAALGKATDYICVMSYDEHYGGSKTAGSVSSLGWYSSAIKRMLQYTEPNKLLMGVPFYARIWTVDASGKVLANPAFTMPSARTRVEESGGVPVWLPSAGQFYLEAPVEDGTLKIWLEDRRSIAVRLKCAQDFGLAGTACWQYAQAEPEIFEVFDAVYKKGVDPSTFYFENY